MMTGLPPGFDWDVCDRARLARDRAFDGAFFTGVRTTRIYCRPVCPVRPARSANVVFFGSAAAAERAGFRPCLRCRPETAPGSPAWSGTATTVARGMRLIEEGFLDEASVAELADRLGVGPRHLLRLFLRHTGAPPSERSPWLASQCQAGTLPIMWAATEEAARGSAIERQAHHRDRWQPGIGKAIARQLAEEGVEVVIAARGREQLEATAAEITKAAGCRVSRLSPTWETDAAAWTDQLLSAPLETNTNLPRFTS